LENAFEGAAIFQKATLLGHNSDALFV
jgi:hypothetical protein